MPLANAIESVYEEHEQMLARRREADRARRARLAADPLSGVAATEARVTTPVPATPRVAPPPPLTSRDTQMMGYHSNSRDRALRGDTRELYGLEMEVTADSSSSRSRAIAQANVDEPTEFRVDAERDGSLSDERGVEFITRRPMTAEALFQQDGWLDRFTSRITEAGVRVGEQPRGYGIHINVNCHGWSSYAKMAFCAAVNLGAEYHVAVAGRESGGGHYGAHNFSIGGGATPLQGWLYRGQPAYVRSENPDCIEVRTFQGTTNPETIRGYVRHLQDLRAFSKRYQTLLLYLTVGTRTGWFTTAEAFRYANWLFTSRPSYSAAIAQLPDTLSDRYNGSATGVRRTHNQIAHYSGMEVINVIFNTSTSFRVRKEALRNAWHTQEPTREQSDDEDYEDEYADDE